MLTIRWTKIPPFHVLLNSDPKDRLSNEQLSEIAEKYMERMGYGNQPYIVFRHNDIDRTHLHVVSCRVDETGEVRRFAEEWIRKEMYIGIIYSALDDNGIVVKKRKNSGCFSRKRARLDLCSDVY